MVHSGYPLQKSGTLNESKQAQQQSSVVVNMEEIFENPSPECEQNRTVASTLYPIMSAEELCDETGSVNTLASDILDSKNDIKMTDIVSS